MARSAEPAEPAPNRPRRHNLDALTVLLVVVAAAKIAGALALVVTHLDALTPRAIHPIVLVAHVVVFGGAAAVLAWAGRNDRRAVQLGVFFLLVAVSFANGLITRLTPLDRRRGPPAPMAAGPASGRVPALVPVAVRAAVSAAAPRRSRPTRRAADDHRVAGGGRPALRRQRLEPRRAGGVRVGRARHVVRRGPVRAGHPGAAVRPVEGPPRRRPRASPLHPVRHRPGGRVPADRRPGVRRGHLAALRQLHGRPTPAAADRPGALPPAAVDPGDHRLRGARAPRHGREAAGSPRGAVRAGPLHDCRAGGGAGGAAGGHPGAQPPSDHRRAGHDFLGDVHLGAARRAGARARRPPVGARAHRPDVLPRGRRHPHAHGRAGLVHRGSRRHPRSRVPLVQRPVARHAAPGRGRRPRGRSRQRPADLADRAAAPAAARLGAGVGTPGAARSDDRRARPGRRLGAEAAARRTAVAGRRQRPRAAATARRARTWSR